MNKKEIYTAVINKNGLEHQFRKLQEELGELIAAVNHHLEGRNNGTAHLHEEFADVEIMMEQLRPFLNNHTLKENKQKKLKRLAKRLKLMKSKTIKGDKKTNGK